MAGVPEAGAAGVPCAAFASAGTGGLQALNSLKVFRLELDAKGFNLRQLILHCQGHVFVLDFPPVLAFFRPTPSWLSPGRSTCFIACCKLGLID